MEMIATAQLIPAAVPDLGHSDPNAAPLPQIIANAGTGARFAWEEFLHGWVRNPHTRAAYERAIRQFCAWPEMRNTTLTQVTPGLIGRYFDQHPGSIPSKKLALAALRALFDRLVNRHILILNPAATVRGEKYSITEGRTPEITPEQVRQLLSGIDTSRPVGLRDCAIVGVLVYTAARAGAIARLRRGDLVSDGTQYLLRFSEKGNRFREIPVRHDLEQFLLSYLGFAGLSDAPKEAPLFCSCLGRTGVLTGDPITGVYICRMVKRRLHDSGLPDRLSPHSFRVATITNLLTNGVALEDVQFLAGHSDPRTTGLYDRRQKKVTRNIVERISL